MFNVLGKQRFVPIVQIVQAFHSVQTFPTGTFSRVQAFKDGEDGDTAYRGKTYYEKHIGATALRIGLVPCL